MFTCDQQSCRHIAPLQVHIVAKRAILTGFQVAHCPMIELLVKRITPVSSGYIWVDVPLWPRNRQQKISGSPVLSVTVLLGRFGYPGGK